MPFSQVGRRAGGLFEAISWNSQQLLRLQAQPPARMIEAIVPARVVVFSSRSEPSMGCRKKCWNRSSFKLLRLGAGLRIDQLQFVATALL